MLDFGNFWVLSSLWRLFCLPGRSFSRIFTSAWTLVHENQDWKYLKSSYFNSFSSKFAPFMQSKPSFSDPLFACLLLLQHSLSMTWYTVWDLYIGIWQRRTRAELCASRGRFWTQTSTLVPENSQSTSRVGKVQRKPNEFELHHPRGFNALRYRYHTSYFFVVSCLSGFNPFVANALMRDVGSLFTSFYEPRKTIQKPA